MKSGRFFVTVVVILGIAGAVACDGNRGRRRAAQAETDRKEALVQEGNAKIKEANDLREELKQAKFSVAIGNESKSLRNRDTKTFETPEKYSWRRLSLVERREVQGKLAQLLQLINRILEINTKKNITVENRDQIVIARESAEAFQRSLENFEREVGVNFDPSQHSQRVEVLKSAGN